MMATLGRGRCALSPSRILNVNDAPASDGFTVDVFISASSADPFFFGPDLFQFTDEDVDVNDQLQSITITDAPDNGTLRSRHRQ